MKTIKEVVAVSIYIYIKVREEKNKLSQQNDCRTQKRAKEKKKKNKGPYPCCVKKYVIQTNADFAGVARDKSNDDHKGRYGQDNRRD